MCVLIIIIVKQQNAIVILDNSWLDMTSDISKVTYITVLIPPNCWKSCSPQPTSRAMSTVLVVSNLLIICINPEK